MNNKDYSIPKITVGIPVYNSEKFIQKTIDSVLSQTFTDFKLIISDNASTDSTSDICQNYAKKDKRIEYIRQEKNKGQPFNFPYVLSKSNSKYFAWLGADDYWESTFLEKNISILESNNNVVGSIGLVKYYGIENFHIKKNFIFKIKNILRRGSNKNHEKYVHVRPAFGIYEKKAEIYLRFNQASFVYGLFRTKDLKNRMVPVTLNWDLILILNLLKDGDFYVIDEVLLHRFVSGAHSGIGHIGFYKKGIIPFSELIFPGSTLFSWCLKNIGKKIYLKKFRLVFTNSDI